MLKLIKPDISYKEQWEEIMTEWDDSRRRPRIFFQPDFDTFLAKLWNIESLDNVEEQIAKSSLFFLQESENQKILGLFSIRHHINFPKDATSSGHIAYGIRPTERGKGYAKDGLRLLLEEAQKIGLDRVLVTCDDDNVSSAKVIETNGGVFESYKYNKEGVLGRRYWIDLK